MAGELDMLKNEIVKGRRINYGEAVELLGKYSSDDLCELAAGLKKHFNANRIDTCSIMNAKSGRCSEDCKWCSQSAFHKTDIEVYPLVDGESALREAQHNASKGIRRFSLVTSGRSLSGRDIDSICRIYGMIRDKTEIKLCASLGLLGKEDLQKLKRSGVERYHCNMETAPSHFGKLCTTHTAEEKMETIRRAQEAGLEVCSGGIIGMGETEEQRAELAVALRTLGVVSIPLNILNPIKGTKLENAKPLTGEEVLRAAAIMKILNPEADIRLAGGRNIIKNIEERLLNSSVSAMIVGDMLTTSGSDTDTDKAMFERLGLEM